MQSQETTTVTIFVPQPTTSTIVGPDGFTTTVISNQQSTAIIVAAPTTTTSAFSTATSSSGDGGDGGNNGTSSTSPDPTISVDQSLCNSYSTACSDLMHIKCNTGTFNWTVSCAIPWVPTANLPQNTCGQCLCNNVAIMTPLVCPSSSSSSHNSSVPGAGQTGGSLTLGSPAAASSAGGIAGSPTSGGINNAGTNPTDLPPNLLGGGRGAIWGPLFGGLIGAAIIAGLAAVLFLIYRRKQKSNMSNSSPRKPSLEAGKKDDEVKYGYNSNDERPEPPLTPPPAFVVSSQQSKLGNVGPATNLGGSGAFDGQDEEATPTSSSRVSPRSSPVNDKPATPAAAIVSEVICSEPLSCVDVDADKEITTMTALSAVEPAAWQSISTPADDTSSSSQTLEQQQSQWMQWQWAYQWHEWQVQQRQWQEQQRLYYQAKEEERKKSKLAANGSANESPSFALKVKQPRIYKPSPLSRMSRMSSTHSSDSGSPTIERMSSDTFSTLRPPSRQSTISSQRSSVGSISLITTSPEWAAPSDLTRTGSRRSRNTVARASMVSSISTASSSATTPATTGRVTSSIYTTTFTTSIPERPSSMVTSSSSFSHNVTGCDEAVSVLSITSTGPDGTPTTTQTIALPLPEPNHHSSQLERGNSMDSYKSRNNSSSDSSDSTLNTDAAVDAMVVSPKLLSPDKATSHHHHGGLRVMSPTNEFDSSSERDPMQMSYPVHRPHPVHLHHAWIHRMEGSVDLYDEDEDDELVLVVGNNVVVWKVLRDGFCEGYCVQTRKSGFFPVRCLVAAGSDVDENEAAPQRESSLSVSVL